uniref:RNA-directed DNA polymerase, eukaryota, reverse transcriptase zinc-binding domain protein n=1 Tax=Tanacetum cinerariifolium TaxID=118510 RepID=A0A6L2JPW1_TANCI|nr:RNA-directed DNA polymerase, eukaryota, reverse transcriptase zinc-binding domain protein [Tanacetum cinerariifolium]
MPPKRTSTSAAPTMNQAAIQQLIDDHVAVAVEAQAANIENTGNTYRNPEQAPVARMCSYKEVMSCQPFNFKGSEGAVRLIRWFKRTKSVFSLSNFTEDCKVKFATAAEALNVAILVATDHNIFHGIKVGKDKLHVSHLYADDALILGEWSLINANNLSRILTCFHIAYCLKVNFNKSKLYGIGISNLELNSIATSIGCLASQFICTYLGLPIGVDMSSLGVYYFLLFKSPKKIIKQLGSIRRKFFWGGNSNENKISWIARDKVISPRQKGGLVIGSLLASNQSMLSKWWWRFRTKENALCNFGIELPRLFKKKARNGGNTSFWHDNWIGGATLQDSFWRLYRLEREKICLVCDRCPTSSYNSYLTSFVFHSSSLVLGQNQQPTTLPFCLTFNWAWIRPPRSQADQNELTELTNLLSDLHLTGAPDTWEFIEGSSRNFTLKSMRNHINHKSNPSTSQPIRWNKFLPAKVNILVWHIMNKRVPTQVNLDKIGIDLDFVRCPLCDDDIETEDHLFTLC